MGLLHAITICSGISHQCAKIAFIFNSHYGFRIPFLILAKWNLLRDKKRILSKMDLSACLLQDACSARCRFKRFSIASNILYMTEKRIPQDFLDRVCDIWARFDSLSPQLRIYPANIRPEDIPSDGHTPPNPADPQNPFKKVLWSPIALKFYYGGLFFITWDTDVSLENHVKICKNREDFRDFLVYFRKFSHRISYTFQCSFVLLELHILKCLIPYGTTAKP